MIFRDRAEAAHLLAEALIEYRGEHPLVLAIPRGAVPMGRIIAEALLGELDVVLVRKVGAPGNPELAVGAVDETGQLYINDGAAMLHVSQDYLEEERRTQAETLRRRRQLYTVARPPIDPAGRVVIVVDDGVATGASMAAALRAVRAKNPTKLVAATAVAPPPVVRMLKAVADDVVILQIPHSFHAVGQFFEEFPQVSDEAVIAMLATS